MATPLRVHQEAIREVVQRLRTWHARWMPRLEAAQRTAYALVETVQAVPGQRFEVAATANRVRLSGAGERAEAMARTLEQALTRLETAFQQAAQRIQEPPQSSAGSSPPTAAVAASFEEAYAFIQKWEGGYVNDPDDRGGPTNLGVTQATYDDYRRRHGLPPQDVQHITREEAEAIYRELFWEPSGAGKLPRPLGLVHMDTAVNMGPGRAREFLQEAQTRHPDNPQGAVETYLDLRLNRYLELARDPSQRKFLAGWLNRLRDLSGYATGDPEFQGAFERKALDRLAETPEFAPIRERLLKLWKGGEGR